jgi:16S rRNA (guanine527-N7)-methyltransferase
MNRNSEFREACAACGLPLPDDRAEQAIHYLEVLRRWNRRVSLTSVVDDRELIRLHFVEAFWSARHFFGEGPVADIGSGAGFPGLAAKLYRPEIPMTLLETNFKKCVFLETITRELGLEVTVVHGAAENWPGWPEIRLATIRALQPEPSLLAPLERNSVPLLQFRGPQSPAPAGWRVVREERFPLSDQRTIALFERP